MFSVVIPIFNHERFLARCVLSAAVSPLVDEVLLLDDGSSDGSYEEARQLAGGSLGNVRDVTPSPRVNRGAHAALNALVEKARCEWIAVLNSDDLFLANRFALLDRRLRRGDCDLVFGDLAVIDGKGRQLGRKRGAFDPQLPFPAAFDVKAMAREGNWLDLLSHQNFVATTSNIVFRKSLFQRIGGFRDFRYIHDWDFVLRAALLGRVFYLPHAMSAYRVHESNTIRESSAKVDAEVRAMFAGLQRDFPEVVGRELFRIGLSENPYLHGSQLKARATLSVPNPADRFYAEAVEIGADGEYTYAPADPLAGLTPTHLQNVVLALAFQEVDFAVVSHSLAELPLLGVGDQRNHVVFKSSEADVFLHGQPPQRPLTGRAMRLMPGNLPVVDGAALFPGMTIAPPAEVPARLVPYTRSLRCIRDIAKPLVFILPALFAVGGVERLVIDMMRELRAHYDFVLITTERLSVRHGSLHGETAGIALGFYELAELAAPALFVPMMRELRDVYRPALLWTCNGAPWQCDHAMEIRGVFAGIPIVDQQAYDTEAGWIARFHEPGIQSHDRFVAINTKIQDTFIRKYGIPPAKIDMIYHSVNLNAVGPLERTEEERGAYRVKYGLPEAGRIFGWVGRLTEQKRPLEFLEFVRRAGDGQHFVMIGNGELAGACDNFIAAHALRHVTPVRFSNHMGELFAVMSGLLGTSAYEGLPISMLEGLSMGVPVFATDVGDVEIVLKQYAAGEVTAAEWNADRYLEGFHAWLANLPGWQARARAAAPSIRKRFAGPQVAKLYDTCFRRAMADMASKTTNQDMTANF